MSRLKLKQVLSNLSYDKNLGTLTVSGSSNYALVVSGSTYVTSSSTVTGSITIVGVDTWGDSGSFYSVDLGENSY